MENTDNADFKYLINLLPFFGAYFILYGAIRLITYYEEFNIEIISFIEFSEVIIYFIRDIKFVLLHCSLIAIVPSILRKATGIDAVSKEIDELSSEVSDIGNAVAAGEIEDIKSKVEEVSRKSESTRERLRKSKIITYVIVGVGFLIALSFLSLVIFLLSWKEIIGFTILFVCAGLIPIFLRKLPDTTALIIQLSLLLLIATYFQAIHEADKVKRAEKNKGVEITLEDSLTLVSDSANYYIGKTNNYTFFYHDSATIVIPNDQIKAIKFPDIK